MNRYGFEKKGIRLCGALVACATMMIPAKQGNTLTDSSAFVYAMDQAAVPVPTLKPQSVFVAQDDTVSRVGQRHSFSFITDLFRLDTPIALYNHAQDDTAPMSRRDIELYKNALALQDAGAWQDADRKMAMVQDQSLVGYVLAHRYLKTSYQTTFSDLQGWMAEYADHNDAAAVYNLARRKFGKKASRVNKPEIKATQRLKYSHTVQLPKQYKPKRKLVSLGAQKAQSLTQKRQEAIRAGRLSDAERALNVSAAAGFLDSVQQDQAKAEIAAAYMYRHHYDSALKLAREAADRSGQYAPKASWVAGMMSWKNGSYKTASRYFEAVASSSYTSGWLASAGGFWAARSFEKIGDRAGEKRALNLAAAHNHTFYGLMARAKQGERSGLDWNALAFTAKEEAVLLENDTARRAMALVALGEFDDAEQELLGLHYDTYPTLKAAVLAYAAHARLPSLALRLGGGRQAEAQALYPTTAWTPRDGFTVDPDLIHAVMRQESGFDPSAKSHRGAQGLMQVMPTTARYIAKKRDYVDTLTHIGLKDPQMSLTLGQDYLDYLLNGRYVRGDMVALLIAYNAGPGNLLKWRKRIGGDDPLYLMEMLPVRETRDYVEKVMTNYWLYQERSGAKATTLAALAKGKTPEYVAYKAAPQTQRTVLAFNMFR